MASIKVVIVGCGGREAALALAISRSKIRHKMFCVGAYVNALMEELGVECRLALTTEFMIQIIHQIKPELCIVGPEAPLADGLIDSIRTFVPYCLGMPKDVARIETDKAWCRQFIADCGLSLLNPTFQVFKDFRLTTEIRQTLEKYLEMYSGFVIKPAGLAGGKGVKVFGDHLQSVDDGVKYAVQLLTSHDSIVIEEKLVGKEFSLMSLTDGNWSRDLPPVRDFKRAYDGDQGPNTGGMGCVCNASLVPQHVLDQASRVNACVGRALSGLDKFSGVLFGGFMITQNGLKLLEYNCRFGDPEIIAALSAVDSSVDWLQVFLQTCSGQLLETPKLQVVTPTVLIYLVPTAYPTEVTNLFDFPLSKLSALAGSCEAQIIPAGVNRYFKCNHSRTAAVIAKGVNASSQINQFLVIAKSQLEGFRWRSDIIATNGVYASVGVNIDAKMTAIASIQSSVRSTHHKHVVDIPNGFGGLCRVPGTDQIIVSSTDSVGSKTEFIRQLVLRVPKYDVKFKRQLIKGLGHDIVNHCVNDILVMGCMKPLTFLDYFASHTLDAETLRLVVEGMAEACKEVDCAIVGGETAEIKDTYKQHAVDVAGFITGVMSESELLLPKKTLIVGDVVIAIPSVSAHTNGYTLINRLYREALADGTLDLVGDLDTLLQADHVNFDWFLSLSTPHKCYLEDVKMLSKNVLIKGLAHITGGGLIDNPPRILPDGLAFSFDRQAIDTNMSNDFKLLWKMSQFKTHLEMYKTFNSGIGMIVVVDKKDSDLALMTLPGTFVLGQVISKQNVDVEFFNKN